MEEIIGSVDTGTGTKFMIGYVIPLSISINTNEQAENYEGKIIGNSKKIEDIPVCSYPQSGEGPKNLGKSDTLSAYYFLQL